MYVPAVDAAISISPVEELILNPVVELNVPPVVPDIVGAVSYTHLTLPTTPYV